MRIVCVLVLTLCACRGSRAQQVAREELARVNDERIFRDELDRELKRAQVEQGPSLEDRRRTLETMIERKLMLKEAARMKVFVPMTQSERVFSRLKDEYNNNDDFGKALEESAQTPSELKQALHDRLVVAKLLREQVYDRIYVNDEELSDYLKVHPEVSSLPERVHCAQIVQKTESDMAKVRGQILEGMPFEEAATRYSIAPEASKGGDLGWFERGIMPTVIEDGCFGLKTSEVSRVTASDFGYHLFKLQGRKPEETLSFDRARDKIEQIVRKQRAEKEELAFIAQLRKKADVVVDEALLTKMR